MENIKIIYEDDDVLAINKPAGLLVHGVEGGKEKTLVDWLIDKYPKIKDVGDEPKLRPGIVHRLDKDTSGVLIIAKNQKAFEYLKNCFKERKIQKKYIALVHGSIKKDHGVIELPIAKSKKDFRKRACLAGRQVSVGKTVGKERDAITEYKVVKRFGAFTLVEAYPKTGRTHQIRVHFKSIGHPIVCDKLYGAKKQECLHGLSRHFLHANEIDLTLPSGGRIKIEADLPEDLQNAVNMLN